MTGATSPPETEPHSELSEGHDIVVVGASAGGVEALRRLIQAVGDGFTGSMFVVLHLPTNAHSALPDILRRAGRYPVVHPADGQVPDAGHIYVAPPDVHMLVRTGEIRLVRGPTENGHRPAIDPLFRSAAEAYGGRVVGMVLSGVLDDGTHGLLAISRRGGITAAQAPEDALYASMPQSAIDNVPVDVVAPAPELGAMIPRLVGQTRTPSLPHDVRIDEVEAALHRGTLEMDGRPSRFTCPDCGGSLWDVGEEEPGKFRCRVGHSWTTLGLLERQAGTLEAALWTALRALSERADLARRMRDDAGARHHEHGRKLFQRQLEEYEAKAETLRDVLASPEPVTLLTEADVAGIGRTGDPAGHETPEDHVARP
jgi:two-component system, chemotaxis family, protein-glutamate methylesterase/glutaminase